MYVLEKDKPHLKIDSKTLKELDSIYSKFNKSKIVEASEKSTLLQEYWDKLNTNDKTNGIKKNMAEGHAV